MCRRGVDIREAAVIRDLVTYIRENPDACRRGSQERNLRRFAAAQYAERSLLGLLPEMRPANDNGAKNFVVSLLLFFSERLPRWLWARWTSRKVMRGWLGKDRIARGRRDLFRVMDELGRHWSRQLTNDPDHEEALGGIERLLFLALLADLRRPPIGRVLPGRRRRTARPVIFVTVPQTGEPGARAAERFLRTVHGASEGAEPHERGGNAPPADKTLVLFRQFAEPRAVLVCGAYAQGASSRKQGPPCSGG